MDCAVTVDLNRYLRTLDEEERRLSAIERRAADLMLTEYIDSRTDMVAEALGELSNATADAVAIHIGHIGNKRYASEKSIHYEQIGRLIANAVTAYCEAEAMRQAESEIENATCSRCFDNGCPRCDPPEPDYY